jgi:hypothetical protein
MTSCVIGGSAASSARRRSGPHASTSTGGVVFQEELSHTTLAHRGEDLGRDVPGAVESLEELQLVSLNAVHATVDDEVESTSWADVA